MEKIIDLDRHRVMMPYAKLHRWALWHKKYSEWNDKYWEDFFNVKNGGEPKLLLPESRGSFGNNGGRKSIIYQATKGEINYTGGKHTLATKLGCHHNTILVKVQNGQMFNGFKIKEL